ncbi:MAG: hypothetical protein U1D30_03165 [Planctomycetota bacterium]
MKFPKFWVLAGLLALTAQSSQAGILDSLISSDGIQDTLEDNSRGLIIDEDGNNLVSSGDIIVGLARIDRRSQGLASSTLDDSKQLILAYSFMVDTVTPLGPFAGVTYKAVDPSLGTGYSIQELLADALEPPLSATEWAQATFAVLEKQFGNTNASNNPVNDVTTAGMTLIDGVMGTGTTYSLDIIGGLVDSSDFFTNLITGGPGLSIPAIIAASNSVPIGSVSGGFTNLYKNFAGTLLAVEGVNVLTNASSYHDYTLTGGTLFGYGSGSPQPTNWTYSDKLDVNLNNFNVPEPSSMLVWAGLFGCVVGARQLRRRAKAA